MIDIPEGLHLYQLTRDRAEALWTKVRDYDRLFSDETRGDKEGWMRQLFDGRTLVLETDDGQAMLFLSRIHEGLKAEVHAIMFDRRLAGRTEVVRRALVWAFVAFDLHRIGASIPSASRALRRWMSRLGFRVEGTVRNDFWYKGTLADSLVMGLVRREVLDGCR
jgi:RimJ/RimL family protein N-acetyltransferase